MSIDAAGRSSATLPAGNARKIHIVTRLFHWLTALLMLGSFGAAWIFNLLEPGKLAAVLVGYHRSIGLMLLVLMVGRLFWRLARPLPPLPAQTAAWERYLAAAVQFTLYACLIAMPILGWLGSNAQGDTVELFGLMQMPELVSPNQALGERIFALHGTLGLIILALVGLHAAGALKHHFIRKDRVLSAMVQGQ